MSTTIDQGGSAFPIPGAGLNDLIPHYGLTKRQWFAGHALTGLCGWWGQKHRNELIEIAFDLADGMIAHEAAEEPAPAPRDYLIWSNEHRLWWRPNRAGYTADFAEAGAYTEPEALAICRSARGGWRPGEPPPEIPVLAADALHCFQKGQP